MEDKVSEVTEQVQLSSETENTLLLSLAGLKQVCTLDKDMYMYSLYVTYWWTSTLKVLHHFKLGLTVLNVAHGFKKWAEHVILKI